MTDAITCFIVCKMPLTQTTGELNNLFVFLFLSRILGGSDLGLTVKGSVLLSFEFSVLSTL